MKRLKIPSILLLTLLFSCNKKDEIPSNYFFATINGKKFEAKYLWASRSSSGKTIDIIASSVNIKDKAITAENIQNNPDFKLFYLYFLTDNIEERSYTWDEISTDSTSIFFYYEFTDTIGRNEIKGFTSMMNNTGGSIEILGLDNTAEGSMTGTFEVTGMNYNEFDYTDTIHIRNGKFGLYFDNHEYGE